MKEVQVQGTWKERVDLYRSMEKVWGKGRAERMDVVQEICKDVSVPALEAGLTAVCFLAEKDKLGVYTKDVLCAALKQVTNTKPTMRSVLKKLFSVLAQHSGEKVVVYAVAQIRDKNPKVIAETLKVLVGEERHLWKHLAEHVLVHSTFLFTHGSGAVREEATKLFQILAEYDEERVADAIAGLKPMQIRDVLEGRPSRRPSHGEEEGPCGKEREDTKPSTTNPTTIPTSNVPTNPTNPTNPTTSTTKPTTSTTIPNPTIPIPTSTTNPSNPTNPTSNIPSNPTNPTIPTRGVPKSGKGAGTYRAVSLPESFYERAGSAVWKERLVMEELSEKLGDPQTKTLSKEDSFGVLSLILRRVGESNNKIFIASMSVIKKLTTSNEVSLTLAREIVKGAGKRLKDKNTLVHQSVVQVLVHMFRKYRVCVLEEVLLLLQSEKSARVRTLQALDEMLGETEPSEVEVPGIVSALVECTKDAASETRVLACTCLSKTLFQRKEQLTQGELEKLGVERLLAKKVEELTDGLFLKGEEEVSGMVDSLCEDIRNTTITHSVHSVSAPMTPIKNTAQRSLGGVFAEMAEKGCSVEDMEDIVSSPIIRNKTALFSEGVPAGAGAGMEMEMATGVGMEMEMGTVCAQGAQREDAQERSCSYGETRAGKMERGDENAGIACFVEKGELCAGDKAYLISALSSKGLPFARALAILLHAHITDTEAETVKEKLKTASPDGCQAKVALESLKTKVDRILSEKSLFEERCVFVSLIERIRAGEAVLEAEVWEALHAQAQRGNMLQEADAHTLIRKVAEEGYMQAAEKLDTIFPASKVLQHCIEIVEDVPGALSLILLFFERSKALPHSPVEQYVSNTEFVSFLERQSTPAAARILFLLRGESSASLGVSPYVKRVRQYTPAPGVLESVDVNSLLNDIIDQNHAKAKEALDTLDRVSGNTSVLMCSSATLINVLLLQLNDALCSGVPGHANTSTIVRILKRVCSCERFLLSVNPSALLTLVSDYVLIITGQIPRGGPVVDEKTRKECGETLIKVCVNGPCAPLFKIYMTLLCSKYKEEKTREVLVKLIWKHSKVAVGFLGDKRTVSSLVGSLNAFYTEFRGDLRADPLISKVLHLHLIEMLKYYGEEFAKIFSITGPVLHQVKLLGASKGSE
ncbi:hypothetical protein NECID01_0318 [Nematocida sp. AWRm77]|nr:hypothetical protein NECID01_0318 [Nematocida sp. AWRm77]